MSSVTFLGSDLSSKLALNFVGKQISAGFPSPAEDYFENTLDLNRVLVRNPVSSFYGRVKGNSMINAGVEDGDLLVIDKSLDYLNGSLAVCFLNGEFTLKRINKVNGKVFLVPANDDYSPIEVKEDDDFLVFGIVTFVIKSMYWKNI